MVLSCLVCDWGVDLAAMTTIIVIADRQIKDFLARVTRFLVPKWLRRRSFCP
jgi:hypothetical protein